MKKKNAFTLAEVLITLGIIGIVAAMTMPTLIQKNNNRVVETRLMKFYSAINQAIKMAEVDYGDKQYWWEDVKGATIDKDGNPVPGSSEQEKWFNKYLAPYMKILKTEILSDGSFIVYFPDGSALRSSIYTTRDWYFYTGNPDKCMSLGAAGRGTCFFPFYYNPNREDKIAYNANKSFEPWKYAWNGKIEDLKRACYNNTSLGDSSVQGRSYCTALIQLNNWKIPDDYPYKVRY